MDSTIPISRTSRALLSKGKIINNMYKIEEKLGSGAYGDCYKINNIFTKQNYAIKIIKNEPKYKKRVIDEIKILHTLKIADPSFSLNFVVYYDKFIYNNHVVLVFELLGKDLFEMIKENNFQGFPIEQTREYCFQILTCLELLDELKIIHTDLKPENIVLDPRTDTLKVIDFGSSFFEDGRIRYPIQSSFYRSPEVIIGKPTTPCIDMWSLGCILYELDTGLPLFPLHHEKDILMNQIELFGMPSENMLNQSINKTLKRKYFDRTNKLIYMSDSKGVEHPPGSKSINDKCKTKYPLFLDFLSQTLSLDPEMRITPKKALGHPWIVEGEYDDEDMDYVEDTDDDEDMDDEEDTDDVEELSWFDTFMEEDVDDLVNDHIELIQTK